MQLSKRLYVLGFIFLGLLMTLVGCQKQSLTTTRKIYTADVLSAQIKGTTSAKKVAYQIDRNKWQFVKTHTNTFVISVPRGIKTQTVNLKAAGLKKQVQVKASKAIMPVQNFAMAYRLAVQKNPILLPLRKPAQVPSTFNEVIAEKQGTKLRAIANSRQLMGLTLIAPVTQMKNKQNVQKVGMTLGTLAAISGANAKEVLKKFGNSMKSVKKGKTTINTIHSKQVNFDVAFSNDAVYIYITHA